MRVYLIKHFGSISNGNSKKIKETVEFLSKYVFDVSATVLLSSYDKIAIQSATMINEAIGLPKAEKVRWLRFTNEYNKSRQHQIMESLFVFAANHPEIRNIIAVSHHEEIKETLNVFKDMFNRRQPEFKTSVKEGSVYLIEGKGRKVAKLFTPT